MNHLLGGSFLFLIIDSIGRERYSDILLTSVLSSTHKSGAHMEILRRMTCPKCNGTKFESGDKCKTCCGEGKVTTPHHMRGEAVKKGLT